MILSLEFVIITPGKVECGAGIINYDGRRHDKSFGFSAESPTAPYQQKPNSRTLLLAFYKRFSNPKGTLIRLLALKGYDLFFGAK